MNNNKNKDYLNDEKLNNVSGGIISKEATDDILGKQPNPYDKSLVSAEFDNMSKSESMRRKKKKW